MAGGKEAQRAKPWREPLIETIIPASGGEQEHSKNEGIRESRADVSTLPRLIWSTKTFRDTPDSQCEKDTNHAGQVAK